MKHAAPDDLLLLAYGELGDAEVARVEAHLRECAACRAQFMQLDTAHAAIDSALPRTRRRFTRWTVGVLAAAAAAVVIFLASTGPTRHLGWRPVSTWSATAGYVTGGAMVDIDAQLTRLEQERPYGLRE